MLIVVVAVKSLSTFFVLDPDIIFLEKAKGKKGGEKRERSMKLIFGDNSKEDCDSDSLSILSCSDGESTATHTEDLIRRGITRQIGKVQQFILRYCLLYGNTERI